MRFAITQQNSTIYPKIWLPGGKYLKFKLLFVLLFTNPIQLFHAAQLIKLYEPVLEQQNDSLLFTGVAATEDKWTHSIAPSFQIMGMMLLINSLPKTHHLCPSLIKKRISHGNFNGEFSWSCS